MFTCGLLRSNFSFAISLSAPQLVRSRNSLLVLLSCCASGGLGHDFFGNRSGRLGVVRKVNGEACAALRAAAQVGGVAEHFGQCLISGDSLAASTRLLDLSVCAIVIRVEYLM